MNHRRVAIMGCGPGGSYLYALLKQKKPSLPTTLFNIPVNNSCGIKGCAWGLNYSLFSVLCRDIGLMPEKYVLRKCDHVFVEQVKVDASIAIIDKPLFIQDLLMGKIPRYPSNINLEDYDKIVDATGFARAYLSHRTGSATFSTIQFRMVMPSITVPHAFINGKGSYSWIFPLTNNEVHVGSGSFHSVAEAKQEIDKLRQKYDAGRILCTCQAPLHHYGPLRPFTEGKIWGLGESIGLVNPVSGAGIISAMVSAQLMVENWDDAQQYEASIWQRYSYMIREYDIADKMRNKKLNLTELLTDISTLRAMTRDVGIAPHLSLVKDYLKIKGLFP